MCELAGEPYAGAWAGGIGCGCSFCDDEEAAAQIDLNVKRDDRSRYEFEFPGSPSSLLAFSSKLGGVLGGFFFY